MKPSNSHAQLPLFEQAQQRLRSEHRACDIVNVASVPQRSPFRYPGGKTWLVPKFRAWMKSLSEKPETFIEPFAGGGIISLTAAFENLAEHIIMVEIDEDVSAIWQVILGKDADWLIQKILSFDLTEKAAREELNKPVRALRQRAFNTLLRNRINHGGILAPGSGIFKKGENGKGILSRWYPKTLAKRILAIKTVRGKIKFVSGDGLKILREYGDSPDAVFFIDPPYTASGKKAGVRLYKHNILDHEELFKLAKRLAGDFLMTYDSAQGIIELAEKFGFVVQPIAMKNRHHAQMEELLIGRNLDWAR